jgi:hypothetical protein
MYEAIRLSDCVTVWPFMYTFLLERSGFILRDCCGVSDLFPSNAFKEHFMLPLPLRRPLVDIVLYQCVLGNHR